MQEIVDDFLWQLEATKELRESLTVQRVNEELNLCNTKYELRSLGTELSGGEMNIVLEAVTSEDLPCIIRASNPKHLSRGIPSVEHQVNGMNLARDHSLVPVPQVYAWNGRMMLIERMAGVPISKLANKLSRRSKKRLFADIVALVGRIHSVDAIDLSCLHGMAASGVISGDWDPVAPMPTTSEFLCHLARWGTERLSGTPFETRLRPWMEHWISSELPLHEPLLNSFPLVFSHGDLSADNILVDANTLQVTALLDWETCGVFPLFEDLFGLEQLARELGCRKSFKRMFEPWLDSLEGVSAVEPVPHMLAEITWIYCSKYQRKKDVVWDSESVALFLERKGHRMCQKIMLRSPVRFLFLQHLEVEGPGNMGPIIKQLGGDYSVCEVFSGEKFPKLRWFDVVVVLGSPNNVDEIDDVPWMQQEAAFLRKSASAGKYLLGICFGGQLIASQVFGFPVRLSSHHEIGFWPVHRCSSGLLQRLPTSFPVFQWHSQTWSLPVNFQLAYSSEACVNQVAVGPNTMLVQFHPEITAADCQQWLTSNDERPTGKYVDFSSMLVEAAFGRNEEISRALLESVIDYCCQGNH